MTDEIPRPGELWRFSNGNDPWRSLLIGDDGAYPKTMYRERLNARPVEFTWGLSRFYHRKQIALTVGRTGHAQHVLLWVPETHLAAVEALLGDWQDQERIKAAVEALEAGLRNHL